MALRVGRRGTKPGGSGLRSMTRRGNTASLKSRAMVPATCTRLRAALAGNVLRSRQPRGASDVSEGMISKAGELVEFTESTSTQSGRKFKPGDFATLLEDWIDERQPWLHVHTPEGQAWVPTACLRVTSAETTGE